MDERMNAGGRIFIAALLGLVAMVAVSMWGCGTKGYDAPAAPAPASALATTGNNALVEAAQLKDWMAAGLVNSGSGQKVVILEVTDAAGYQAGHIPGSLFVDKSSELDQTRLEGVAQAAFMVADGTHMDNLIKRSGIDQNTTVVFSTSKTKSYFWATRAYFVFRYWGFPKERLKVLNGYDTAWDAAYSTDAAYKLTSAVPSVAASSYGVRNIAAINPAVRASLGRMIAAVKSYDGSTTAILDVRGAAGVYNAYNAASNLATITTVFEGHLNGAARTGTDEYIDAASKKFLPIGDAATAGTLLYRLNALNGAAGKTNYVYCVTGTQASSAFFVMDGILGWPSVKLYDGSWSQWGMMSSNAAKFGKLPSAVWDTFTLSTASYNTAATSATITTLMTLDPVSAATYTDTNDSRGNQIENEDDAYAKAGVPHASGASGGSSPGGGC